MSPLLLWAAAFFVAADCPPFHLADFPEEMIERVFTQTDLGSDQIHSIQQELNKRDSTLQDRIRLKLSKVAPEAATQRLVIGKAEKEAFFDIFTEALQAQGIQDPIQIRKLFDSLLEEKAKAAWNYKIKCG